MIDSVDNVDVEGAEIPAPLPWNHTWMRMAKVISQRSKDPSSKIGCVIVSPDQTQIVVGYNGFIAKAVPDLEEWWHNRDRDGEEFSKYDLVLHDAVNAILHAKTDLHGWTMYTTMHPCLECVKTILAAGIRKVYYAGGDTKMDLKTDKGKRLFDLCGGQLIELNDWEE